MSPVLDCMRKGRLTIRESFQTPYLDAKSDPVDVQQSPGRWGRGQHPERRRHAYCWFGLLRSHEANMARAHMMLDL